MSSVVLLLGAFFGSALVTWLCVPAVIWLANRQGWLDQPGGRRIHDTPTPRAGGIAVFLGLVAGSLVYGLVFGWDSLIGVLSIRQLLSFFLPCALVFLVGLLDDIRGLAPSTRLIVEGLAALFVIQAGFVIDKVALPNGQVLELGFMAFPVTLAWILAITNAFNLIDGVDGLLPTVGAIGLLGCAVVGVWGQMVGTPALAMALAGALLGFLPWNWHPARIFLGDSGSLVVGFTMACWSLKVSRNINNAISIHVPLLLCALPIAELLLTLARRYVSGQPFFEGDRSHIHHVLLKKGLAVSRTVLLLGGVTLLFASAAFLSRSWRQGPMLVGFFVMVGVALGFLRWLGYVELELLWDRFRQVFRQPRRGLPHVLAVARAGNLAQLATSFSELADQLEQAANEGNFSVLALEFAPALLERHGEQIGSRIDPGAGEDPDLARCQWVRVASSPESPTLGEGVVECSGSVRYRLPLPADGRLGWLVVHRVHDSWSLAPPAQDLRRYLADPLAHVIQRLAGDAGASAGTRATPDASSSSPGAL